MIGQHLADPMHLYAKCGEPETNKCLLTAGEKGVDIVANPVDPDNEDDKRRILTISPLGSTPVLKDVDFLLYGTRAIMSYLDDKGFGPSLVPRNGVVRGMHYQWACAASRLFGPAARLVCTAETVTDELRANVNVFLNELGKQLEAPRTAAGKSKGDYIVGEFSMADIHWAGYIHNFVVHGHGDFIEAHPAVNAWWQLMKTRQSTSKERFVAYSALPTKEEIDNNTIRNVSINVA